MGAIYIITNQQKVTAFLTGLQEGGAANEYEVVKVTAQGELLTMPVFEPVDLTDEVVPCTGVFGYTVWVPMKGIGDFLAFVHNTGAVNITMVAFGVASGVGGGGISVDFSKAFVIPPGTQTVVGYRFVTTLENKILDKFAAGSMRFGICSGGGAATARVVIVGQQRGLV